MRGNTQQQLLVNSYLCRHNKDVQRRIIRKQLSTVTMTFWTHVTHTICPTTAMQNILNDRRFNVTNSVSAHLRLNTTLSVEYTLPLLLQGFDFCKRSIICLLLCCEIVEVATTTIKPMRKQIRISFYIPMRITKYMQKDTVRKVCSSVCKSAVKRTFLTQRISVFASTRAFGFSSVCISHNCLYIFTDCHAI